LFKQDNVACFKLGHCFDDSGIKETFYEEHLI